MEQEKFHGSIKVMRSYDYCHFEIQLGASEEKTLEQIDEMRKEAARLTDKAVKQYQQHKAFLENEFIDDFTHSNLRAKVEQIMSKSEAEWTPEDKAKVKRLKDIDFKLSLNHNYQDDWDEIYSEY